ncbi:MAG: RNA pseudouridine synthase [Myxococcota bacterium]
MPDAPIDVLTVLTVRDGWLAVHKPPGVLVVPGRGEDPEACLWHRVEAQRGERLWVVHRLDRDTTGVVVFARTAEAHRRWSIAFEAGRVEKEYLAFTAGIPSSLDVTHGLLDAGHGRMRIANPGEKGAKSSRTRFERLRTWTGVCLVRCRPTTGRQHQIRVHLAAVGAPILCDPLYGEARTELPLERLALHASRLVAPHELGGDELSAPMPADLVALQRHLESRQLGPA